MRPWSTTDTFLEQFHPFNIFLSIRLMERPETSPSYLTLVECLSTPAHRKYLYQLTLVSAWIMVVLGQWTSSYQQTTVGLRVASVATSMARGMMTSWLLQVLWCTQQTSLGQAGRLRMSCHVMMGVETIALCARIRHLPVPCVTSSGPVRAPLVSAMFM